MHITGTMASVCRKMISGSFICYGLVHTTTTVGWVAMVCTYRSYKGIVSLLNVQRVGSAFTFLRRS